MNTLFNNNFWKNKKIFITGHTGFKGSWLCLLLNLLGAEITGYSLKPKTKKNLYEMANIKKFVKKSIIADVRDYKKLYQEINQSKAEIIFHLAAQALVVESYKEPEKLLKPILLEH
jgi:CDP-glucose 4,6-dehydratase